MKPDEVTCQNCGKQIAKGKWCSDKCRMAFKRKPEQKPKPNTNKGEQTIPEQHSPNIRDSLTKTDQTFYDRAMRDFEKPYYNFSDELREEECLHCGDKFKTSMAMLRFCSYQHYSDALSGKK